MHRQAALEQESDSVVWPSPERLLLEIEKRAILVRPQLIGNQVHKGAGGFFTRRTVVVVSQKEFRHRGWNGGMLEYAPVYRIFWAWHNGRLGYPGRHQHRRNAHAQSV